jgi:hypothetical protein
MPGYVERLSLDHRNQLKFYKDYAHSYIILMLIGFLLV